ncbi:nitric oxide reductase activation protein NorD [Paraburkholderia sp. GAS334]|uniref:nitric oxide reductase activation protein NorD n=1 Tax=Paraburkholderia sp. GAS334 TaxID=3035131 RepID=UPI003D20E11D
MRADQAVTGSLDAAARVLAFYLKAAWSIAPKVQSLAAQRDDGEMRADRPLVTEPVLFLPDARVACDEPADEALFYLASAAHAAAHLTWSTARFDQGKLRPLQVALVGAFEDARVERLAVLRYPGLRQWWLPFHRTGTQGARTAPALIARLSRALLDPDYADDDGWVTKGRRLFDAAFAATHGADPAISRELGNLLGNDLGQMRVQFNAKTYAQEAAYRDDNSLVWNAEPTPIAHAPDDAPAERNATLQESPNLRELLPDAAQPPRGLAASPGEAPASAAPAEHDDETPSTVVSVARYREWDYVIRRYRSHWCRVESLRPEPGDRLLPEFVDEAAERRVRAIFRAARHRVAVGSTRAYEGDVLDLDACIMGRIDARRGMADDVKGFIVRRMRSESGPLAVLLDLSASAAGRMRGAVASSCMLGRALAANGRPFAMYGFHSDGRQRVRFHIFKDFADAWSGAVETRLMAVRPGLSTRFGAALRHVGATLAPEVRSGVTASVLVVSDGVPFDVDSFDPRYLQEDMRRAIRELAAQGIRCACLSFDAASLDVAVAMFGRERVALAAQEDGLAGALQRIAAVTA